MAIADQDAGIGAGHVGLVERGDHDRALRGPALQYSNNPQQLDVGDRQPSRVDA